MKIVFPVPECTFLRYFVPLAVEAKKRGHEVVFRFSSSGKYNCPRLSHNYKQCKEIIEKYGFVEDDNAIGDICFVIEGIGRNLACVRYSLTYMTDFMFLMDDYELDVDHIVMPSEYFAKKFNKVSPKNLYLGSPKYDVELNSKDIFEKYSLDKDKRYALIIYPRSRDLGKFDIEKICKELQEDNFVPIIKTRGKDPIRAIPDVGGFSDESWFPHTTMELIHISDRIINTGSTMIKEAVMLDKGDAVVNYNVKPFTLLEELYEKGAKKKYMPHTNASKNIVDHMEENYT